MTTTSAPPITADAGTDVKRWTLRPLSSPDSSQAGHPPHAHDSSIQAGEQQVKLQGLIFDLDGTLCYPQTQMFASIRSALNLSPTTSIQQHLRSLASASTTSQQAHTAHQEALTHLARIQAHYIPLATPRPGLATLRDFLQEKDIKTALVTKNFTASVNAFVSRFLQRPPPPSGADGDGDGDDQVKNVSGDGVTHQALLEEARRKEEVEEKTERRWAVSPILDAAFVPNKPDPAALLHAVSSWSPFSLAVATAAGEEEGGGGEGRLGPGVIMVGDGQDDMRAARAAGAGTILVLDEGFSASFASSSAFPSSSFSAADGDGDDDDDDQEGKMEAGRGRDEEARKATEEKKEMSKAELLGSGMVDVGVRRLDDIVGVLESGGKDAEGEMVVVWGAGRGAVWNQV